MKITRVDAVAISIPLRETVADAVRRITHRDHFLVHIHTDDQLTGAGFTLGYDSSLAMVSLTQGIFQPILTGADPFQSEHLWAEMYRQSIQAGRRGAALRAISAIDIALWDLRAKYANLPVHRLLGFHSLSLPCYATGGYFRDRQTLDDLVREYASYFEQGFSAAKLKVGKFSPHVDASRLAALRRAFGDEVEILLDANGGWPDATAAVAAVRRLEEHRPFWIEEPVRADNVAAMARIAEALETPVATGELESTRWAFADLLTRRAADILQPDATVVGGVGEWLKVAHMAASFDIPIAPHYNWDIHSSLLATVPNALFIEYFVPSSEVKVFDVVLENPIAPVQGFISPREEPGFGLRFRQDKIAEFRIG